VKLRQLAIITSCGSTQRNVPLPDRTNTACSISLVGYVTDHSCSCKSPRVLQNVCERPTRTRQAQCCSAQQPLGHILLSGACCVPVALPGRRCGGPRHSVTRTLPLRCLRYQVLQLYWRRARDVRGRHRSKEVCHGYRLARLWYQRFTAQHGVRCHMRHIQQSHAIRPCSW
jgi:hypothetical protein